MEVVFWYWSHAPLLDDRVWLRSDNIDLLGPIASLNMGNMGARSIRMSKAVVVGTDAYLLWHWSDENVELWKYDAVADTFTEMEDCGAGTSIPASDALRGIAYDDSDILYFILVVGGINYLYTYSITNDILTQKGEYDISLMLDRNTDTSNDIPFNLEKAFSVSLNANNEAFIYQISKSRGGLYTISRLTLETGDLIVAITDTYLIIKRTGGDDEVWQYIDFITYFGGKSYIHARTRNYWKASLWVTETGTLGDFEVFDGMFLRIIGYMTYAGNGWYHNEPSNFNDETAGVITVAGDMAWLDTLTLPDTCSATLGIVDGHKNVLGIAHAGIGDPIIIHEFPTQEATGKYEWFWGSSDVVRNQTIRFRGTGIAIYLRINTSKYTYLDSLDAEIEIIGATPSNDTLDHFKLVWDCVSDTFDLYINEVIRVTAGEFNNPDTYIDELYMASITGAVYTQYIDAPGNVADADYYEGMNLLETDRNAVVMEGYVIWDDEEHPRKISLDSPAMFDLKNKTEEGEYSGRTDQHIASNLVDWANYLIAGTMANGAALGTLTQRGRKSLKVRINGHAQYDQFIWVIVTDDGQGLLNYNAGTVDSYFNLTETNKLGKFKKKKLRKIINQINLKGAMNPTTGAPYKWTEDDLASQQIYGVQPIFRTFANLDTEPLLETQAQSILTMDQSTPYKYTFTKAIGSEGLVLPSETINLTYTPKSVIAGDRIIDNIKFFFRKKRAKWTVVDAIIYTSDMDILIQETQENTDLIEQLGNIIHNLIGGFVLYFQDDASGDIGGYKQLTTEPPADAIATSATAITGADQEIEQWATESGVPALNLLQSGITQFHYHAWKSAGIKDIRIYFKFYKRTDPGGVETLLYTTEESAILPGATAGGQIHALAIETELDDTDRIVVKLFATPEGVGSTPTLSFSIEGDTATRAEIPAPIGSLGGVISDVAYDATTWNANLDGASKNAIRDKFESLTIPQIIVGTYTGDGVNLREIDCGFVPEYVILYRRQNAATYYALSAHKDFPTWIRHQFHAADTLINRLDCDGASGVEGFELNNSDAGDWENANGFIYYFIAFRSD